MRVFGYDIKFQKKNKSHNHYHHHGRVKEIDVFQSYRCMFNFGQSDILDCEKMISNRLSNVEFHSSFEGSLTFRAFSKFLLENRLQIIQRVFMDGYVIINTKEKCFVNVNGREKYTSFDGRICFPLCEHEVFHASETFEATGRSDYDHICDKLRYLNVVNSSDLNLIENYGAMGIVSPEVDGSLGGNELTPDNIEELQDRYRKSYGITLGKWSLMFVPKPTKYTPINLPISQLDLTNKRLYALKSLYAAFGIPKELSVYFESSKYANRNEAELDFYSTTINAWAELLLSLLRKCYAEVAKCIPELQPLTTEFWFDFVGVYALQESERTEKVAAREEILFWKDIIITLPEYADTARQRIENLIESL